MRFTYYFILHFCDFQQIKLSVSQEQLMHRAMTSSFLIFTLTRPHVEHTREPHFLQLDNSSGGKDFLQPSHCLGTCSWQ